MSQTPKTTKLQRWLDLIAHLIGRKYPVTVDEIMERVPAYVGPHDSDDEKARESSRKMFERDKAELREMGIPIETITFTVDAEAAEGYRLSRRDFYLPYLELLDRAREGTVREKPGVDHYMLAAEDLVDAHDGLWRIAAIPAMPLAREARHALRKIAFDLPLERGHTDLWLEHPDADQIRERLVALADAIARRKRARFRYHGIYRGEATDRDVAGYGLLSLRGHWYLVGHDALRDAQRIFRVDRMETVEIESSKPTVPDYEIPDDVDLARYRDRDAWELGEGDPVQARVRFRFPRSLWAERNAHGERVETETDGAEVRRFAVHQVDPFLRWILTQEGEAEILDPPELRSALAAMASEVAALYGPRPAG